MRNYRREVVFARHLARRGFAVERFHYRFSGNSDGEDAMLTYETMTADAIACAEHLLLESGAQHLFLVGTRWGGLIAASVAAASPRAELVIWAPLLNASLFFREAFRSSLVAERDASAPQPTTREQQARLLAGEAVDSMAYTIYPGLYQSSHDRALATELGATPRPMLLITIGPTMTMSPPVATQVDGWRSAGFAVDAHAVRGEESWWLINERWQNEATRPLTRELVATTSNWIADRMTEGTKA
jgi:pimeloyl-ACP methyl ester carboxylesterase